MLIEFFLIAQRWQRNPANMSMASTLLPPPKPMDPSHDPWIAWKTWKKRGSAYVRHQLWRMTESSPGNAGNAPARTSVPARNIKARHNCSLLGTTLLRQWDAHRFCCYRFSPSFTSRWADTMSPDAVTLWSAWYCTTYGIGPCVRSA
ncbi:uncharacterized protein [Dermacentor albipictus]|uniref:uncharacterized protein n=1 Tax=Dermacentor albipictus TaxID=60249 RepID=UPI0038FC3803